MTMIDHRAVRNLLYDFLRGGLSPEEKTRVERHLAGCPRCTADLDALRLTLPNLEPLRRSPADDQPAEFWQNFARSVDARIDREVAPKRPTFAGELENLMTWLMGHQRWVVGASGAVAVVVVALLIWNPFAPAPPAPAESVASAPAETTATDVEYPATTPPPAVQVRARAADYFRKSKALIVGLSNLKTDPSQPVDLSAEQQLSQQLAIEARFLRRQPLDLRSVRLLNDLEKVMITVSSAGAECDAPTFHTIQTGIHRSNLLFKIRMAESTYDTLR